MHELEERNVLRPLIRSWAWVLVFGGGLLFEGVIVLLSTAWVSVYIDVHDVRFYHSLLSIPVGVFSILSGWQFIRCARLLAPASAGDQPISFREFAHRARLAFIFGGSATLCWLFMAASGLMFRITP